jgi:membrane fusion protein, multidrug efflux system
MGKHIAAVVAAVAIVAAGVGGWQLLEHAPTAAAARQPGAPAGVPVTLGTVTAKDVPVYVNGIGSVQAYNTVTVKSRVDGQIVAVDFTEGEEVKQDELLFQIDPRPYRAALEQAQAVKAKDEAQLESAQLDLARYAQLLGRGYQTQQSYDQQTALVAQLKAALTGDQAQIDAAQLNLGYADIRAPIAGRLGARLVDIGNLVHASDNAALVTITQLRPIYVSFTLPQEYLDEVRQNQMQAPLVVDAISGDGKRELAQGKLTLIDNTINQSTGTILLKATFANLRERLWPGEFVNARVVVSVRHDVPTVPAQTVQQGPDGYFAYIVNPGDTVERRAIVVAAIQDGLAIVTEGLKPGEEVVVSGQYRLTNGARIVPQAAHRPGSTT